MHITLEYHPDCKCKPFKPIVLYTQVVICANCGTRYLPQIAYHNVNCAVEEQRS